MSPPRSGATPPPALQGNPTELEGTPGPWRRRCVQSRYVGVPSQELGLDWRRNSKQTVMREPQKWAGTRSSLAKCRARWWGKLDTCRGWGARVGKAHSLVYSLDTWQQLKRKRVPDTPRWGGMAGFCRNAPVPHRAPNQRTPGASGLSSPRAEWLSRAMRSDSLVSRSRHSTASWARSHVKSETGRD